MFRHLAISHPIHSLRCVLTLVGLSALLLSGCVGSPFAAGYADEFEDIEVRYKGNWRAGPVDTVDGAEEVRREALELIGSVDSLRKGTYDQDSVNQSLIESNHVRLVSEDEVTVELPRDLGTVRVTSIIVYLDSTSDAYQNAVLVCKRGCSDLGVEDSRAPLEEAIQEMMSPGNPVF